MFKKYLFLFFFSILLLQMVFPQQIFAATTSGTCSRMNGFLGFAKCDNWDPGKCSDVGCNKGIGMVFQCGGNGVNFIPDTCCVSIEANKSGEDVAFENNLDCGNYYTPGYKIGCRDNNKRYGVGDFYCKDNKVMECGVGGTIISPSSDRDCPGRTNTKTNLSFVCVETQEKNAWGGISMKAECMEDDKFGETYGDPASNNDRCCCINVETATAGINTDDQFGMNAYINRASSMVMGQINDGGEQFKQINRIQSACVANYEPKSKGVNLYDIFGSNGTIDTGKLLTNSNSVCSIDCKCVADPEQTEASAICNSYLNKKDMTAPQQKEIELCRKCFDPKKSGGAEGYWSAIGCIKFGDWGTFFQENIFPLIIGFGGICVLLCIIFSAIAIQTSAGNPEKIKKAQQTLTSCITGLIMIIFAVFILRLIGVSILKIPGFQ